MLFADSSACVEGVVECVVVLLLGLLYPSRLVRAPLKYALVRALLFLASSTSSLYALCQGVVGSPAGAAGSPRSCPCIARARGRQPAAGEKSPVINEVFSCFVVRLFVLRPRIPSSTKRFWSCVVALSAVFVYCVSASFWRFHILIVVCILVVARAVESSCVLVRRLRYT